MNDAASMVQWLRHAAPYIHQHRGKKVVIHFAGDAIDSDNFDSLIHDLALLHALGMHLVLVYGARPQINQRLQRESLTPRYEMGLRITDSISLGAVIESISRLRVLIEAKLSLSLENTPMSGSRLQVCSGNYVIGKPIGVRNGIDFEHTGSVRRINQQAIETQLKLDQIILLSPLGYSSTGDVLNISSEEVATAVACSISADKLIILNEDDCADLLPNALDLTSIETLCANNDIPTDTKTHLQNAVTAINAGVKRCHIIDRSIEGGLLMELFSLNGTGSMLANDPYETIRQATVRDIPGLINIIQPLSDQGLLVSRSFEQLEEDIERFTVIERDNMIIGCAAFYIFDEDKVGEIACLAVRPNYRTNGLGDRLLSALETEAKAQGLQMLFVLSTQTMHWFQEKGFNTGKIEQLPIAKAKLYNYQRNSKIFTKSL